MHYSTRYFCDQVPNQRWADTFQMFNQRVRPLQDYRGDLIPPHVMECMRLLAPYFDHLIVMTPYHDVAGAEWQDVAWMRSIDPYVVGFIEGVPHMFVVARFSDSGVFPLYHELLGGTIEFLRRNLGALRNFNNYKTTPYWYGPATQWFRGNEKDPPGHLYNKKNPGEKKLGDYLTHHTQQMISAFDEGALFDWLKGDK